LGHIILEEGITVELENIEGIRGWSTPNNVTEVRSFMGLVRYDRVFIEGLSNISHPITCKRRVWSFSKHWILKIFSNT
jgi:hypothetical protein